MTVGTRSHKDMHSQENKVVKNSYTSPAAGKTAMFTVCADVTGNTFPSDNPCMKLNALYEHCG